MDHPQHRWLDWRAAFPWDKYPKILGNQEKALDIISQQERSITLELPTGSGKTAIGYTFLKALEKKGAKKLFYIAPTKTIVDQVKGFHPDVKVVYGRNEYPCLYYTDHQVGADECPCSLLDCDHRVSQETGETQAIGVKPCPYLCDKYIAGQGGIVVCTISFYLFNQLFSKKSKENEVEGLVIDEGHRIAQVVRNSLSYEVTDYHLERSIDFLEYNGISEAKPLRGFLKKLTDTIKQKPKKTATILEDDEVRGLLSELNNVDPIMFNKNVRDAIKKSGMAYATEYRESLKRLETFTRDLVRYYRSFEYSLPAQHRGPLNYTYAYFEGENEGERRIGYRLYIKAYYVAPLIRRILSPHTLTYSATIGDAKIFEFETGIKAPFYVMPSEFSATNTRVFMPNDTPNLAVKERRRNDLAKVLRKVAKSCRNLADKKIRSLIVVVSKEEQMKFMKLCGEEGVRAISYGNGVSPRVAVEKFKAGEGDVLVGTVANYGEGVDLPKQTAQVIFFLRPGYPHPYDPATVFEEKRFRNMRWAVWNWRVMIEALQVRGRNIRSASDTGVTIFISQQFRRFLFNVLPDWLEDSYRKDMKFDECIEETMKLLEK